MYKRITTQPLAFLSIAFVGVFLASCSSSGLAEPLPETHRRPTPLHFGLYVTPDPKQNPIHPPEHFTGYHVAVDFEVSAEELSQDVPVFAICNGEILFSGFAEGYGGLIIQRCGWNNEDFTVLYGHLLIESLTEKGRTVSRGEKIAILAPARSNDSGGNRKHLHLGIHRGAKIDFRGYVQNEHEIAEFVDAEQLLPELSIDAVLPPIVPYWETQSGAVLTP